MVSCFSMSQPEPLRLPNRVLLVLGVFLIFGQIGVFIALLQPEPPGWIFTILLWAFSGLIAVGWAESINRRGKWLLLIAPLILIPALIFPLMFNWFFQIGLMDIGNSWPRLSKQLFAVVGGSVSMSLGFTLVVQYISAHVRIAAADRVELMLAARVHDSLVRPIRWNDHGLEVHGISHASNTMGGDLIDLIEHDYGVDLILADVSGHGVKAGIVMAMLKSSLRTSLLSRTTLQQVVSDADRILYQNTDPGMFATGIYIRIQVHPERTMSLVVAGHPPVFRIGTNQQIDRIESQRMPLGITDNERTVVEALPVNAGDLIAMYTDGLVEAMSPNGEQFGLDRLEQAFKVRSSLPLQDIINGVLTEVRGHGKIDDDATIVLVRVTA